MQLVGVGWGRSLCSFFCIFSSSLSRLLSHQNNNATAAAILAKSSSSIDGVKGLNLSIWVSSQYFSDSLTSSRNSDPLTLYSRSLGDCYIRGYTEHCKKVFPRLRDPASGRSGESRNLGIAFLPDSVFVDGTQLICEGVLSERGMSDGGGRCGRGRRMNRSS